MRRWSALESFLVGAVPTALVFGVVALAIAPSDPATRPSAVEGSPTEDDDEEMALARPAAGQAPLDRGASEALDSNAGETPGEAGLGWDDVATMMLLDQADQIADAGAADAADAGSDADADAGDATTDAADADAEPEEEEVAEVGPECGPVTCPVDFVCCNQSCGICTPPGQLCSQTVCGMPMTPSSVGCGPATCNVGELCCDPACGVCVSPGEPCQPGSCLNPVITPFSEPCGMQTCNTGFVCCNPSCGICARPGEPCRQEPC